MPIRSVLDSPTLEETSHGRSEVDNASTWDDLPDLEDVSDSNPLASDDMPGLLDDEESGPLLWMSAVNHRLPDRPVINQQVCACRVL